MNYIKEFDDLLLDESKSDGELLSIARDYIAELQGKRLMNLFKVTRSHYYGYLEAVVLATDKEQARTVVDKQFPLDEEDKEDEFLAYEVKELPSNAETVLMGSWKSA